MWGEFPYIFLTPHVRTDLILRDQFKIFPNKRVGENFEEKEVTYLTGTVRVIYE